MQAKPLGHAGLKNIGLDKTWIPRGHFGELSFTCSAGHVLIHNQDVRSPNVVVHMKGDIKPQNIKADILAVDVNNIVQYQVDPSTGMVTFKCPIDGEILGTYTPNVNFKNFDGVLQSHYDGKEI